MKEYRRSVIVRDDNVERALRKFKKKIQESGLLDELRSRETYEKPTTFVDADGRVYNTVILA